jgi:hypothetical protein
MTQIIPFSNTPLFLTGVVPSSNTVSTAYELSRFAEILRRGGELDGVRVMSPRRLRRRLSNVGGCDLMLRLASRQSAGELVSCWAPTDSGHSERTLPQRSATPV